MRNRDMIIKLLTLLVVCTSIIACQNKSSGLMGDDMPADQNSPFDSSFYGDLNDSLAGNGNIGGVVGSGSTGGLTDADKQALTGMTQEMETVNTTGGALPQNLIDEAKKILDMEANTDGNGEKSAQIQQMKMALVGKIIEQCAEKVAPLAPIPGQTLMGVWKGGGACAVEFEVKSKGPFPQYEVTGKTTGKLVASADGGGELQGDPFKGPLSDSPRAGTGKLVHPTFHKSKGGGKPCEVAVNLERSTNPIPENYIEAMKRLGQCHRQALLFMSPVMDKMFKNMPQNLSGILMNRGIGVPR